MDELYDLAADPYEMTNLIGDSDHHATLLRLHGELDQLLERTQSGG